MATLPTATLWRRLSGLPMMTESDGGGPGADVRDEGADGASRPGSAAASEEAVASDWAELRSRCNRFKSARNSEAC